MRKTTGTPPSRPTKLSQSLLALITAARDSGNPIDLKTLTLPAVTLDPNTHADLFKDILISESDFDELTRAGYGPALSQAIVLVRKNSPRAYFFSEGASRVKVSGKFAFKEDDLSDKQSYDELDISTATVSSDTVKALHESQRIKKVVLNAQQAALLSSPMDYSKIIISGDVAEEHQTTVLNCKHFRGACFHALTITDFDVSFSNCTFAENAKIIFYLRYPKTDEGAKVAVDAADLLQKYNQTFKTTYETIFAVLSSSSLQDAKKKKEVLEFIEQYCITAVNTKNVRAECDDRIRLSLRDAQHFATSSLYKGKKFSYSHLEFNKTFYCLLQDRKSVQESPVYKAKSKQAALHSFVKEAEKSKALLRKNGFDPDETITAEKFIQAIKNKKYYFRGLTVTGNVDLSVLSNKELKKLDIANVTFKGVVNFSHCNMNGINAQGVIFESDAVFHDADMRDANFKGAEFRGKFSVDQSTLLENYYRTTGVVRTRYKSDDNTRLSMVEYVLNHAEKSNPVTVCFAYDNARITEKSRLEKIFLSGRELSRDQVAAFYKAFSHEYTALVKKDSSRFFRGNIINRLKKVVDDTKKVKMLLSHVQREPGGRTDRALQSAIAKFTENLVANDRAALHKTPATVQESSHVDDTGQSQQTAVVVPTTVHVSADPLLPYLNDARNGFDFEKIYADHIQFLDRVRAYEFRAEKSPVIDGVLSASIENAKQILDQALSVFGPQNSYLFGRDNNSDRAITKRDSDRKMVIAAYVLLKSKSDVKEVEKYNTFIEKQLYPHYFNFALRPAAERKEDTPKFRYNLAEELFVHAGIENAYRLAMNSVHRHETETTGSQFFARKASLKEVFERSCLMQWGLLPLSSLKEAKLVVDDAASRVDASRYDIGHRLCVERVLYLSELLKAEKYDAALREAKAIEAAYHADLVSAPWGQRNLLREHVEDILFAARDALKQKMITDAKAVLKNYKPSDDALLNQGDRIQRLKVEELGKIFTVFAMRDTRGRLSDVGSVIMCSLESNHTLSQIAEAALQGGDFSYQALLRLNPQVFYNDYQMVWVGEDAEHVSLCERLRTAIAAEETTSSRRNLLEGLHACISKLKPVSQLLIVGTLKSPAPTTYVNIDECYVRIEEVAVKIDPKDIALMHRGAVGAEDALRSITEALDPIWAYPKVQRAITRSESGKRLFADPKLPATKSLVDDPKNNFIKYELMVMLHNALDSVHNNLSHTDVARNVNYYQKIVRVLDQMIRLLTDQCSQVESVGEAKGSFYKLLNTALTNMVAAHDRWVEAVHQRTPDMKPTSSAAYHL